MQSSFLKNIIPREYQIEIFNECKDKNSLVVLPTGLGKTLIALMIMLDRMEKKPGKVLFLAPTRPLAEQHLKSFKKFLPELYGEIVLFTGTVKAQERKKIWQTADIIFSTPQCIANDLKKNVYDLSDVTLLIEDEAHRCIKNYDYNFVSKTYQEQAENPQILGLTASPGSDTRKIKEICKNLNIEHVEIRSRESPDVKKYLQELEFEKIKVDFPPELEEIRQVLKKLFDQYVEELRYRNVLFGMVNKITLIELQKKIMASLARGNKNPGYFMAASACAQAVKIQHALELLETQTLEGFNSYLKKLFSEAANKKSRGVVKLVSKPEFNFVYSYSTELLTKNFEHPKIETLVETIRAEKEENENFKAIIFSQFRETASVIAENLNKVEGIKSKVFVGQSKKMVGKKTSGLSQKEQKKIIEEFTEGEINVLCATSIAEEGLDIPEVSAVIFYEPIPSAIRSIQRAGRTARLHPGKLIILITKNTRDESFYYVSRSREKRMQGAIESVKEDLANGKKENKSEEQKKLKF